MNTSTTIFNSYARPATWAEDLAVESSTVSWFARFKQVLSDWAQKSAESRSEAALWDLAQSDSRVMSELMLARKRDDAEEAWVARSYVSPLPELEAVAEGAPKQPSLLGQGWAGVIEDAYQTRSRDTRLQFA